MSADPVQSVATSVRPTVRLTPWIRSWRAGLVPFDDAAVALEDGTDHAVLDMPGSVREQTLREALTGLAKLPPEQIRLVLPAPGDPRGLPGPGPFTSAALLAGEGIVAGAIGLVPEPREYTSGSGDTWLAITWRGYEIAAGGLPPELVTPSEAEADLGLALAASTQALAELDVARWRPSLAPALTALRRGGGSADLPAGYDPRSRRLYARAGMLDRVLALAEHDEPGGAINAYEANQRAAALRPLATACRRALVAACNSPLG
ncbi:hypothetical protein [Actinocatenispora thailandica]|uniref:hypothetical protein n=1 Tax=Actinocatenispora thailandica TaxID=227318 RepID=UPI001EF2AB35|nr:hypothetical protein [Actinocatenispora thailandica]